MIPLLCGQPFRVAAHSGRSKLLYCRHFGGLFLNPCAHLHSDKRGDGDSLGALDLCTHLHSDKRGDGAHSVRLVSALTCIRINGETGRRENGLYIKPTLSTLTHCAYSLRLLSALTLCAHSLRSLSALTPCAYSLCSLSVLTLCAYSLRSLFVLTLCAYSLRLLSALTLCAYSLRSITSFAYCSIISLCILRVPPLRAFPSLDGHSVKAYTLARRGCGVLVHSSWGRSLRGALRVRS